VFFLPVWLPDPGSPLANVLGAANANILNGGVTGPVYLQ
jgi:hypothetical protein